MPTGALSSTITDPSGTAIVGVVVNARLKPRGGFRADATEVSNLESTTTDASGNYSFTLEYNSNITPAGTYWEVEEQIPDASGGPQTWACNVAAASQTVFASLISTLPATATGTYLTQSQADSRYQALGSFGGGNQIVDTNSASGVSTAALRADAKYVLGTNVAGIGLNLNSVNQLDVGAGAGIYAVGTNSVGVRVQGFLTATASVAIQPGYRVPAAQTATPTLVTVGANDLWVRDGVLYAFRNGAWVRMSALSSNVVTAETLTQTATSYFNLATVGPSISVETGPTALIAVSCNWFNPGSNASTYMGVAVTGVTTINPSDTLSAHTQVLGTTGPATSMYRLVKITGLTPGVNIFTPKWRVTIGTSTISERDIAYLGPGD